VVNGGILPLSFGTQQTSHLKNAFQMA